MASTTSGDLDAPLVLNSGVTIPRMGLGVFRSGAGAGTRDAVTVALSAGYRHIDTAQIYRNESEVGVSVRASGIPRSEIFVTTKLWNEDQGYDLFVPPLLPISAIWVAHIAADRVMGYGLKYQSAFGETHLGRGQQEA